MEIPPYRRYEGSGVDWENVALELQMHEPNEPVLLPALTNVPKVRNVYKAVRQGYIKSLRDLPGIVRPNVRTIDGEGRLYLTWIPDGEKVGYYEERALTGKRK